MCAVFFAAFMPNPKPLRRSSRWKCWSANGLRSTPNTHAELADVDAALTAMHTADPNRENPFLHLSMHLSISEQCSIDQPRGIRQAVELLTHRLNSLHDAHHQTMACLGQMVHESQRSGRMPDGEAYIACVQRHATKD
jgi:hypothetical protein